MQKDAQFYAEKMPNIFNCITCDFKSSKKSDWVRHILTRKHRHAQFLEPSKCDDSPKTNEWNCDCGKSYKQQCSYSRHKKKCAFFVKKIATEVCIEKKDNQCINPDGEKQISNDVVVELIKENKELRQMLLDQNNKIFEIAKQGRYITNNTTNNHFNMNFFLNEKCKDALNLMDFVNSLQLQLKDLEETAQLGYAEGISKIFIKGLKELDIYKRPIHCSDLKREVLYIKDQDAWEKEDENKAKIIHAIKIVGNNNIKLINNWQKENPKYNDPNSKQNDKYIKILLNSMSGATKEEQENNVNKVIKNLSKEVVINKV
jgi:hypothetical protein